MAESNKTGQLNVKQENAIDLLVQGKTDGEVAQAVGMARQTIQSWRTTNSLFKAELNRRREELWAGGSDRLRALIGEAVSILEGDLANVDEPRLRQQAAVHILKAVGIYGADLKPAGETDADAIEITEFENRKELEFKKMMAV